MSVRPNSVTTKLRTCGYINDSIAAFPWVDHNSLLSLITSDHLRSFNLLDLTSSFQSVNEQDYKSPWYVRVFLNSLPLIMLWIPLRTGQHKYKFDLKVSRRNLNVKCHHVTFDHLIIPHMQMVCSGCSNAASRVLEKLTTLWKYFCKIFTLVLSRPV